MKHIINDEFIFINEYNLRKTFDKLILREEDKTIIESFFDHLDGIIWLDEDECYVNVLTFAFQLYILVENLYTKIIDLQNMRTLHVKNNNSVFPDVDFINFFYNFKSDNDDEFYIKFNFLKLQKISKSKIDLEISKIFNHYNHFSNQKNKKYLTDEYFETEDQIKVLKSLKKSERNKMAHSHWQKDLGMYCSEQGVIDLYIIARIFLNYFSQ